MSLSVNVWKPNFPVDWRILVKERIANIGILLVEERIANIGIPLDFFVFMLFL